MGNHTLSLVFHSLNEHYLTRVEKHCLWTYQAAASPHRFAILLSASQPVFAQSPRMRMSPSEVSLETKENFGTAGKRFILQKTGYPACYSTAEQKQTNHLI